MRLDDLGERYVESELKNQLENEEWFIQSDTREFCYIVKWNNYDIPSRWLCYVKTLLLLFCGGYTDIYGNLLRNTSSLKTFLGDAKRFFIKFEELFEGKNLSALNIENLTKILHALAIDSDSQLKASTTCEGYTKLANRIRTGYSVGNLSDGLTFDIPQNSTEFFFRDLVETNGVEFSSWYKGGTYGGLPAAIAMALLSRSLEILRSNETRIALKVFEFSRADSLDLNVFFKGYTVNKCKIKGNLLEILSTSNGEYAHSAQSLLQEINDCVDESYRGRFFESKGEFTKHVQRVYDYSVIAICILTGYRIIELRYLLYNHIYRDERSKDWIVRSEIVKTHKGIGTIRAICDEAAEFIDVLLRLSEVDKVKENRPIFEFRALRTTKHEGGKSVPYNTMLHRVKDGYADFLETVGEDFRKVCGVASPHIFRHAWVDVALRCHVPEAGYNNVTEEIRHHLRHRYGSTWTRRYMDGKFTPVHMQDLEQNYMADLIGRIGGEDASEFFGPMAVRIKKLIESKAEFLGVDEVDAKEQVIEEQKDNLLHLSGHPWGICMLMKDTETQAKCYDKMAKVPKYDEASSFENCSGCTHRLSHKSQLEDVTRFVLAHEDFVQKYPIQSTVLKKVSTEAARRGRLIIKEIEGVC